MLRFTYGICVCRSRSNGVMELCSFVIVAPEFHPLLQYSNTAKNFKNKITPSINLISVYKTEIK